MLRDLEHRGGARSRRRDDECPLPDGGRVHRWEANKDRRRSKVGAVVRCCRVAGAGRAGGQGQRHGLGAAGAAGGAGWVRVPDAPPARRSHRAPAGGSAGR